MTISYCSVHSYNEYHIATYITKSDIFAGPLLAMGYILPLTFGW